MLTSVRRAIASRAEVALEVIGLVFALSGATVAAVFGRGLLALKLGAVVLGIFFRLTGRRRARQAAVAAPPGWVYAASALLSVVEVGVLVEATALPVRFHQEGFALFHWVLVLTALFAAFWLQLMLLRAVVARRRVRGAMPTSDLH